MVFRSSVPLTMTSYRLISSAHNRHTPQHFKLQKPCQQLACSFLGTHDQPVQITKLIAQCRHDECQMLRYDRGGRGCCRICLIRLCAIKGGHATAKRLWQGGKIRGVIRDVLRCDWGGISKSPLLVSSDDNLRHWHCLCYLARQTPACPALRSAER